MNLFGYLGAVLAYGILGVGAFAFGMFEGDAPHDVVYKIQTVRGSLISGQCVPACTGTVVIVAVHLTRTAPFCSSRSSA